MSKKLCFQANLLCTINGKDAVFKSNEVFVEVLERRAVRQKSILIDRKCLDLPALYECKKKVLLSEMNLVYCLLLYLIC